MDDNLPEKAIRPALGVVTNHLGRNRGFSLVSPCPNSSSKSGNPIEKSALIKKDGDDAFWKEIALAVERLKKEKCGIPKCPNYAPELDLPPSQKSANEGDGEPYSSSDDKFWMKVSFLVDQLKRQRCGSAKCPKVEHEDELKSAEIVDPSANARSLLGKTKTGIHNSADDAMEPSSSVLDNIDLGEGKFLPNVVNLGDIIPNLELTGSPKNCIKPAKVSEVLENDSTQRDLAAQDAKDDGKTLCVDYHACSRSESVVNSMTMESLEDKFDKLPGNTIRPALGDETNHIGGKRGFSLISPCPNLSSKSGNPIEKPALLKSDSDDAFWKKVALAMEKLKNEQCGIPKCPNYAPELDLPSSQKSANEGDDEPYCTSDSDEKFWKKVAFLVDKLKRQRCGSAKCPKVEHEDELKGDKLVGPSANSGSLLGKTKTFICNSADEAMEPSSSVLSSVDLGEGKFLPYVVNVSDITKQTCTQNLELIESSKNCERNCFEDAKVADVLENDSSQCDSAAQDAKDDGKTHYVDYLTCSRSESVVSSRMTESLEGKSFKLEGCTALNLKGDDSYNSAAGLDVLKSCSCSFCTKAAYIWSDLHYQDVKGRISILTKSKKEASNLAQRYSCENAIGKNGLESSSEATHLEFDLMNQWNSLFLQMESAFGDESSQLQTNFLALKDLRDDFKTDLESINATISYVQTLSSAASDHMIL